MTKRPWVPVCWIGAADLKAIAEAMTLQYPDFRGAPPIAGREGRDGKGQGRDAKGSSKGHRPPSSASTSASSSKGSFNSSRHSSTAYKSVYAAEATEGETLESIQEDDVGQTDQEPDPDVDDQLDDDQDEELIPDEDEGL